PKGKLSSELITTARPLDAPIPTNTYSSNLRLAPLRINPMSETLQFKTELKQLLHLIIHSLYSHKDIFLRELISNASDAIDTARFQSLANGDLVEGDADWKIKISADEGQGTLTISDNGVGMSRATIVENLGTIAKSGTRAFLESLKEAQAQQRPELIGQFGV